VTLRAVDTMQALLIPIDGSDPIRLTDDITVVGRKRGTVDLFLDHSNISKMHCLIVKTDGLLFVRDLGSTNGTKVNGQRITRGALLPGDELSFAGTSFRVHLSPDEPATDAREKTEIMSPIPDVEDEEIRFDDDASSSDVRLLDDDLI
jgi:pSer/pThr/pTyr-binding forkhead associated (FHA) protein